MKWVFGRDIMQANKIGYRLASLVVLFFMAQNIHAWILTKDTVYETTYLGWNDSASLLNKTSDTVKIDSIKFSVPPGKYAEIAIRYGMPYQKYGTVGGPVFHARRSYANLDPGLSTIPPGGRILISGFDMEICLECPLAKASSASGDRDTLLTYLIFDTKEKSDTLVVIGVVDKTTSGIRIPLRPREMKMGGTGSRNFLFFDFLGRIRFLNGSTPG
jgi:hypothetical protein